ncbi:hypothetical protein [Sporosarcina luteola]|uniref:hypothetical protein n=1 Tax=Sporosarcina luteola TaxID=582850 RepID=UPI003EBACF5F
MLNVIYAFLYTLFKSLIDHFELESFHLGNYILFFSVSIHSKADRGIYSPIYWFKRDSLIGAKGGDSCESRHEERLLRAQAKRCEQDEKDEAALISA